MKKVCMILVLCLVVLPCCKKKLPTQADIPTKVLPTIEYFHATPTSITIDGVSILSWSAKNATNITINQGVGTVSAKGTVEVSPEETTTYTLTATNSDGQKTQSCKIEVTVLNLPIIDYFTATPPSIMAGEYSTLSWSVQSEGLTEALRIEPLGNLTIPWTGVHPVSPSETTTYTLIATNSDGETTASCEVEILPRAVIELYFAGGIVDFIPDQYPNWLVHFTVVLQESAGVGGTVNDFEIYISDGIHGFPNIEPGFAFNPFDSVNTVFYGNVIFKPTFVKVSMRGVDDNGYEFDEFVEYHHTW